MSDINIKPTLYIIGGKSVAKEILDTVTQFYPGVYANVYNVIADAEESVLPHIVRDRDLLQVLAKTRNNNYIIGFTNQKLRIKFHDLFQNCGVHLVNIIHPASCIFDSVELGVGNYIAANVVISSNAKIGNSNLINYNVTIGHDVVIGTNCIINPGARISGQVTLEDRVLVGANSFIKQSASIGRNTLIDALTYIDRDIPENSTCTSRQLKIFRRLDNE